MTRGMYSTPPKRCRPNANWMVMTIPMKMRRHRDDAHRLHAERLELVERGAELERPLRDRPRRPAPDRSDDLAEVLDEAPDARAVDIRRTTAPAATAAASKRIDGGDARVGGCSPERACRCERWSCVIPVPPTLCPSPAACGSCARSVSKSRVPSSNALGSPHVDEVVDAAVLLHDVDVERDRHAVPAWRAASCGAPRGRRRARSPGSTTSRSVVPMRRWLVSATSGVPSSARWQRALTSTDAPCASSRKAEARVGRPRRRASSTGTAPTWKATGPSR